MGDIFRHPKGDLKAFVLDHLSVSPALRFDAAFSIDKKYGRVYYVAKLRSLLRINLMKIISDREFRNEPGKIRKALANQDIVMTSRGKPYAVLLPVDEQTGVEEVLELAARIRAQMALSRVRKKASDKGIDRLSSTEIDKEIKTARNQRKK